ncbi:hypothetical protein M6K066_2497 [Staphylococcus aureus]|uniref:hypothetical protein n=1 Tax=Staphylococcus aureus TaxID=1280 RepID=UPI000EBB2FFA|nr:hypothetical protein M6K066_2497 [Staphylococcus aureus]
MYLGHVKVLLGMFLSLKTLYRKRTVIWPFYFYTIIRTLSFFIPNFQDIKYQPLLGYAAFLAIMSLLISFLLWYFTRNWRKERKARKLEKQIEKYGYEGAELRRKDKK